MTESEAKKYMLIEKECINRDCDRDCANCDIVQDVEDLNNAYDVAINALKKQIARKPNKAIDRTWGIENEVNVCPVCDCYLTSVHFISIDENEVRGTDKVSYCESCGQKIDWNE